MHCVQWHRSQEKTCPYLTFALKFVSVFSKLSLGAAKIIQSKSFKDNDCSMTMFYKNCFTLFHDYLQLEINTIKSGDKVCILMALRTILMKLYFC